uniref:ribosomal protein L32 n=1 Tax=Flexiglena variabilis TaxID=2743688 RepID=UPI0023AAE581|nr:ribosomal protein L32 [Flexiglena variabilis]WCH63493.1 ribosomal protein L32 [Flexiglena variabilis]
MAQPKKKMSRSRRDSRRANWRNKVKKQVLFAISLGKSISSSGSNNFILSSD